ncbi:MAG: hypothetical protein LUC33_00530 [Prevotellaceae bacterium]|nr:hypothetical protein [Prevotellaceae bacterium]
MLESLTGDRAARAREKYEELKKEGEGFLSELQEKLERQPLMFGDDIAKEGGLRFREDDGEERRREEPWERDEGERRKLADYLMGNDYVAELTGQEFTERGAKLVEAVKSYFDEKFGGKVEREGYGEVALSKDSVRSSLGHGSIPQRKAAAFMAVPYIIRDGREIDNQKDWKERGYESATFAAPVRIGGGSYVGVVVVTKGRNASNFRFYLHKVTAQKSLRSEGSATGFSPDLSESPVRGIAKVLRDIIQPKENGMKIAEEGEESSNDTVSDSAANALEDVRRTDGNSFGEQVGTPSSDKPGSAGEGLGTTARNTRIPRIRGGEKVMDRIARTVSGRLGVDRAEAERRFRGSFDRVKEAKDAWRRAYDELDSYRSSVAQTDIKVVSPLVDAADDAYRAWELEAQRQLALLGLGEDEARELRIRFMDEDFFNPNTNYIVYHQDGGYAIYYTSTRSWLRRNRDWHNSHMVSSLTSEDTGNLVAAARDRGGLRGILGEELYGGFLDDVFRLTEGRAKETIANHVILNGYDIRKGTEAWLRSLGEDADMTDLDFLAGYQPWTVARDALRKALALAGRTEELTDDGMKKLLRADRGGRRLRSLAGQAVASTQEERERALDGVRSAKRGLNGVNIRIVHDITGINDPEMERRIAKGENVTGWYDVKANEVVVYLPGCHGYEDGYRTVLHEAVGHQGLRDLLGKDHYDKAMESLYDSLPEKVKDEVRQRMTERGYQKGWSVAEAMDEFLAERAEDNVKPSWWRRVLASVRSLLRAAGINLSLSDGDIDYMLYRSGRKLRGKSGSLLDMAAERAMRLKADKAWRDGSQRKLYDEEMRKSSYQALEALFDSMRALHVYMRLATGNKWTRVEDIEGWMNPYLGENRLSSVNEAESKEWEQTLFAPLWDEVGRLAPDSKARELLNRYMMSKHGLERNLVMAEKKAREEYESKRKEHDPEWDDLDLGMRSALASAKRADYAGLTGLYGMGRSEWDKAELRAREFVNQFEQDHDTDALWERINAVNKRILKKQFDTGIISRAVYDRISSMYRNYIPLRGFDETTSDEAYAYLAQQAGGFNAPVREARGRKSVADDPLANMVTMADAAILHGNRNLLVKQRLYNFVLAHKESDIVSVSEIWLKRDDLTGDWTLVTPDYKEGDTAEQMRLKGEEFEERMRQLTKERPADYRRLREAGGVPYKILGDNLREHQILVKVNGRDILLTVNGSPRLAQAVNGKTNPDNDPSGGIGQFSHFLGKGNRTLSQVYTTWSPDFIMSNFMRDMLYSNTMAHVKEGGRWAWRFNMNCALMNPATMMTLLELRRHGSLNMGTETHRLFDEFMRNGGETGYKRMADLDKAKRKIRGELRHRNALTKGTESLVETLGEMGRATEMAARFAAYVTSRQEGRSVDRAIWDAKEISVNFNKKGAADRFLKAQGQTRGGNAAALLAGTGRGLYIFWNASLQGLSNVWRSSTRSRRSKVRAAAAASMLFALGFVNAMWARGLGFGGGGGDGDDAQDEDGRNYFDLPDYIRRSSIVLRGPKGVWLTYALPQEYRAVYGMGELYASYVRGEEAGGRNLVMKTLQMFSQALPLDPLEGQDEGFDPFQMFMPHTIRPLYEVTRNRSWTGMPIWRPETEWNKNAPRWTRAYNSTGKGWVALTKGLSSWSGGKDELERGWADLNPAALEYLFKQYAPFYNLVNELSGSAQTIMGMRPFDWRFVPVLNRLVRSDSEQTRGRSMLNRYFRDAQDVLEFQRKWNKLTKNDEFIDHYIDTYGEDKYKRRVDELDGSPLHDLMDLYNDYKDDISDLLIRRSQGEDVTDELLETLRDYDSEAQRIKEERKE